MAAHSSIGSPANKLFAWAPSQSRQLLLRPSQTDSRTRISCFDFEAHRSEDLLRFLPSTDLVLGSPPLPPLNTANNHQLQPLSAPAASVATANHQCNLGHSVYCSAFWCSINWETIAIYLTDGFAYDADCDCWWVFCAERDWDLILPASTKLRRK